MHRKFIYLALSFLLLVVISVSCYLIKADYNKRIKSVQEQERLHINELKTTLNLKIKDIITDLNLIVISDPFQNYLSHRTYKNYTLVANQFLKFIKIKGIYDQIRFIDSNGKEVIRVNYNDKKPQIVSPKELQDKHNRYYFKETIGLNKNQVYISKFDLNVEHGKIEIPYKPTIRFCKPVFDRNNQKVGILVLNYLGNNLLKDFSRDLISDIPSKVMFINKNGYFLLSELENTKTFGFMFEPQKGQKFSDFFPTEWDTIRKNNEGAFLTNKGFFTFTTFGISNSETIKKPHWKIISFISLNELTAENKKLKSVIIAIDILLALITVISLMFYIKYEKQKKQQERKIRESEEKFKKAFYTSPDVILVTNLETGKIVEVNYSFTKKIGYSKEEVLNKSTLEIDLWYNPKDRDEFATLLKEKGEVNNLEKKFKTRDGKVLTGLMSAKLVNFGGKPHILTITRDITKLREIQDKLKESELKLQSVLDAPEGVIIFSIDTNYRYTTFSRQHYETMKQIWGVEIQVGENILDYIQNEEDKLKAKNNFDRALRGEHFTIEEVYGDEQHRSFWENRYSPIFDKNGSIIGVSVFVFDITRRKQAELELFKLTQVVRQSKVSVIITDTDGNIEYANPFFQQLTGYSFDEVKGKNPRILKSGKHKELFYKNLWNTIKSGRVWTGEFLNKKKDGSFYWEEATITPLLDDKGNIVNFCAIKTDITKRKEAEQELANYRANLEKMVEERTKALKVSEEKFRTLAENSDDVILRFDNELRILYVNPAVEKIIDLPPNKVIGKKVSEVKIPESQKMIWEKKVTEVFETGTKANISLELPNKKWIDWAILPEFNENNEVIFVAAFGRDITELKLLERKLNNALKKEKELNEIRAHLISTISHEFRTPLTAIYSSTELLEMFGDTWDEAKKKKQFEQIRNSVNRLTQMLEDVIRVNRFQKGKLEINYEDIDIKTFVDEVLNELEYLKSDKHKFSVNIRTHSPVLKFDKNILRTFLNNLISNAIKYSPDGGTIDTTIESNEEELTISVADSGVGISDEEKKRIFDDFYRAEKVSHIQGTGLGLSIVKNLISKLNGNISVESKLGEGTKFTITIPLNDNKIR